MTAKKAVIAYLVLGCTVIVVIAALLTHARPIWFARLADSGLVREPARRRPLTIRERMLERREAAGRGTALAGKRPHVETTMRPMPVMPPRAANATHSTPGSTASANIRSARCRSAPLRRPIVTGKRRTGTTVMRTKARSGMLSVLKRFQMARPTIRPASCRRSAGA